MKRIPPNDISWLDHIHKPTWFIDIGVGVPNSEAWRIKEKWGDVKVFGVEPNGKRFENCSKNYPGTILHNAIWREDADLEMQNIDGMSINFPREHQVGPSKTHIKGRSLDSLEKEFGPWNNAFIWSDTEGAELEMLKGARGLLKQGKISGLNLEVWKEYQAEGWCLWDEIVGFLDTYGFEPKFLTKDPKNWYFADAIFLPKEA